MKKEEHFQGDFMVKLAQLNKKFSKILKPKAPFNFDATVYAPAYFPIPDFLWQKGIYWQTMNFDGKLLGIKMENKGTIEKPKVKLTIFSKKKLSKQEIENILNELNRRYGFEEDISEFCQKVKNDKFLRKAIKNLKGMRLNCANSLYELLIIAIVLQNATVRRTVQMMNALLENYGQKVRFDGKEMYVFWTPEILNKATEKDLRGLRVGYRTKFLKRIAKDFAEGKIDEETIKRLSKEEAKKELLKIYGIGPASVDYILFEVFRRWDVFDYLPPWEQKILSRLIYKKSLVPAEKVLRDAEKRWGKWKRLAIHYIFEDIFWKRKSQKIPWLEKEIRL